LGKNTVALVTSAAVSQIDLAGHANSRRVARKVLIVRTNHFPFLKCHFENLWLPEMRNDKWKMISPLGT